MCIGFPSDEVSSIVFLFLAKGEWVTGGALIGVCLGSRVCV